jgi:hypothetical protein
MGILLNPSYRPYTYEYIVLVKNAFLVIFGLGTSFQLSKLTYSRELYVVLNRVKRSWFYFASLLTSILIVGLLGIILDIYILLFSGLGLVELFKLSFVIYSVINLILTVSVAHLFSVYIVQGKYCTLGFILVGLGCLPNWYEGLPGERLFNLLSYLCPPLGANIVHQQTMEFSIGLLGGSLVYLLVVITIGALLIKKRSFTTLK